MRSVHLRTVAVALLVACGIASSACDRQREGAVQVAVIGEKLELVDPSSGQLSEPQAAMLTNVAQGLVRFDARGQIVPGLAERWNVTDDGLSYIFRLANGEWPNGEKITAHDVARILRRQIAARSKNALKDAFGAVEEIVAMTDRVIEIRLTAPRPHLLQLLAQPEMGIVRDGQGAGPFRIAQAESNPGDEESGDNRTLHLTHDVPGPDGTARPREEIILSARDAASAIRAFVRGDVDLVLGGHFAGLPAVRAANVPGNALRFDPASGLFGLMPARAGGPLDDAEFRSLLSQAIDRDALIAALAVPGLLPRATLLEPGLETPDPAAPGWTAVPIAERRAALAAAADRLFEEEEERPQLRIWLPQGPGAELLLNRLAADWGLLGIGVDRAENQRSADLILVDQVAPSTSAAWFLRRFRCEIAPICVEEADDLLAAARAAPVSAQRSALLTEAARLMDEAQLFLPLAAPIRWSLVSDSVQGFSPNRFTLHPLLQLREPLNRERTE